jgi:hypothetical protein
MSGSRSSQRVLEWQRRMTRFGEARQSVAEFCRQEGVSSVSFYQWRKRLAAAVGPAEEPTGFKPVRLVAAAGIAVDLPGGTHLHVPTSDPQVLRLVIELLARLDAQQGGDSRC